MAIRKFGPVVAWLACAAPAFAEAAPKEKEVWITIGTDALEPARASFKAQGLALPAPALEKGGVAVLRVRESQLEKLSEAMHDKLNRCAGFIAHDTEAQARLAVEGTSAPQSLASLVSYTLNNSRVGERDAGRRGGAQHPQHHQLAVHQLDDAPLQRAVGHRRGQLAEDPVDHHRQRPHATSRWRSSRTRAPCLRSRPSSRPSPAPRTPTRWW